MPFEKLGLSDAILIKKKKKDNHLAGLDPRGVAQLVSKAAERAAGTHTLKRSLKKKN
jgi:nicotinate-nucleotide pyrophosphorylase